MQETCSDAKATSPVPDANQNIFSRLARRPVASPPLLPSRMSSRAWRFRRLLVAVERDPVAALPDERVWMSCKEPSMESSGADTARFATDNEPTGSPSGAPFVCGSWLPKSVSAGYCLTGRPPRDSLRPCEIHQIWVCCSR